MEQKYYWMVYRKERFFSYKIYELVTKTHPLTVTMDADKILLNWKEITQEEYLLFNSI